MYIKPPSTAPYSIRQLRLDNPDTSFPANPSDDLLAQWGVYPVEVQPVPDHDLMAQQVVQLEPAKIGDKWIQGWGVTGLSFDAISENMAQAVANAIALNNAAYEAAIESLTAGYPPSEIATWERQRAEVMAWHLDDTSPTPWIDIAAQARGIPRADYLARTYAKAAQFAQASAYLTGLRQRYETEIKAAVDPSSVLLEYSL